MEIDVFKDLGIGVGGSSNVKSIQRGITRISSGETTKSQGITTVDIEKSILQTSLIGDGGVSLSSNSVGYFYSDSAIVVERQHTYGYQNVAWQLIEFNNVKSIQRGLIDAPNSGQNIAINSVDMQKSILFVEGASIKGYDSSLSYAIETDISIRINAVGISKIAWQLIEFK